ncbi:hypothetical protein KKF61_00825 [Patescibacteria group bacterium]|nr:hypothetical protein [Patescibacteria group bacterium]MBU0964655.1 hypothetical protein [Patescibacteria group bacterium]
MNIKIDIIAKYSLIIFLVMIIAVLWLMDDDIYSNSQNSGNSVNPGLVDKKCTSRSECIDICGDDECYVENCIKLEGSNSGKCGCLKICE